MLRHRSSFERFYTNDKLTLKFLRINFTYINNQALDSVMIKLQLTTKMQTKTKELKSQKF